MENGFAISAILGIFLNLFIPDEPDDVPAIFESTNSDDGPVQTNIPEQSSTTTKIA
jgi:NCS2 family nucleobase:cation symporter-2